jgi:hypothetical protein
VNRARKAEPRFDLDVKKGEQGELLIGTYLDWIAAGNGRVEVKRKGYYDLAFYVETHCDKGRAGVYQPSGISITTAHAWAFVIAGSDISLIVPTEHLRSMLEHVTTKDRACNEGSCPTRGKLINLAAMLYEFRKREQATAALPVDDNDDRWILAQDAARKRSRP